MLGKFTRGTQPINVLKSNVRWSSFSFPFCSLALWMNQWVNGSPSFLPLFHYTLLPLFSFLKKKKRKYDFTFQIKNLKHAGGKKKERQREGEGNRKAQPELVLITFHPEVSAFLFFFSCLPCPSLCVPLAKSHIPSVPPPAQTPFGGPSFPAAALGITCNTHICKINQVWKGQGVPAQAHKGSGCRDSRFLFSGPQGEGELVTPCNTASQPQLPLTGTEKQQRPWQRKMPPDTPGGGMCRAALGAFRSKPKFNWRAVAKPESHVALMLVSVSLWTALIWYYYD